MKRVVSGLLALAVFALPGIVVSTSKRIVRPVYAQSGCSLATLSGNYVSGSRGTKLRARQEARSLWLWWVWAPSTEPAISHLLTQTCRRASPEATLTRS